MTDGRAPIADRPKVLFACVHHAGRLQMAAGEGIAVVRSIREQIRARVEILVTSLGLTE
ncbi:MAG: hypothetical protein ABI949_18435 [Ilumatobacteraceae bacterium]